MARVLPPSASVAQPLHGEKLFAPAAARNSDALLTLLQDHAPKSGNALEIASGTGQHVTSFAAALREVVWQPTDLDPARCASINAHIAEASLINVVPAAVLNATQAGWSDIHPACDLILLVNLLHLISEAEALTLITEAADALAPMGTFILYGPFKRSGRLISAGDEKFDAELRTADPAIGYKDDLDIMGMLRNAGLTVVTCVEMPANNLALIARNP